MHEVADEYEALLQFLYLAPVGIVQTTLDGEISLINPASATLLMPLSRDGSLTNLFVALESVAPDLRHLVASFDASHGMVCDALRVQVSAGGRGRGEPQVLSLTVLKLDQSRLMVVLGDITQQVRRDRLLKQNEVWLNAILTGITDYALVNLDTHGCLVDWNASIGRVTGNTSATSLGRSYGIFFPDGATTKDRLSDRLRESDRDGWSLDEGWCVRADGSRFWGSAMIAPLRIRDETGKDARPVEGEPAYCLVIRDISDKRETSERQRKAMSCDHLTGIPNRRAFFEAAALEMDRWNRSPRDMSLILFDADHFKAVNDTFGHATGDAVLRDLADSLNASFRQVDLVGRVGGEEFAVLLPSTALDAALAVAERLRLRIESKPVEFDGASVRYTISGGVATMDATVEGLDDLMKRADRALYAAKAAGRNRVQAWVPG